ncbi:MAG: ribosome-associated translation inhibitor RaiA [Phycisphaerales bacterium]|nr:ribosome-associated translation inhibitor RaiA [Phycisphaerales bacterium]
MQVTVSGRHMGVGDELREYCEKKAERLVRFYDRIQRIDVVLDGDHGKHSAEIIVHTDGTHPFVASEEHDDVFAAVDVLLDKVENQIRRHKERLRNRKHPQQNDGQA